jgi:hypothetical protein
MAKIQMREVLRARCSIPKLLFSNVFCNNHYFKTIIIKTSQKVFPNTELNVDTVRGYAVFLCQREYFAFPCLFVRTAHEDAGGYAIFSAF